MATNADHLAARPMNWAELSWLRLPPLTIRALPDPCLADPLRPETWRPLVAAREAAPITALLCREGHA